MSPVSPAIQFFIDFASSVNREIRFNETSYPSNMVARVVHHRRFVSLPMNDMSTIRLLSYHDPKGLNEEQSLYSGFFTPCFFPVDAVLTVRKKFFLQRLGFGRPAGTILTTGTRFGKEVLIAAQNAGTDLSISFLNHPGMQEALTTLFEIDPRFMLGFNSVTLDFESDWNGKAVAGVYLVNDWFSDRETIAKAWNLTEKIFRMLDEWHTSGNRHLPAEPES